MIIDINNPDHTRCRVYLHGEDVSRWCCYADDGVGLVKLYRRNKSGNILAPKVVDDVYGDVRIECHPSR